MASQQFWQVSQEAGTEDRGGKRFFYGFLVTPDDAPPIPDPPSRDDIFEPPVPALAGRLGIVRTEG